MKNLILTILFVVPSLAFSGGSDLCEELQPKLKSGDLIFISSNYYLFRKVSEATNTWANHVGIAFERDGEWVVAESKVPLSKVSPFCEFVGRTKDRQVTIRRVQENLSEEDVEALWESAMDKMGILYHLGFKYHSSRQFCSKFVYQVYLEAMNTEVGEIQTFRDVLEENPNGDQTFWKWWFFGMIPWDRETVTPRNQLLDPDLITVHDWELE